MRRVTSCACVSLFGLWLVAASAQTPRTRVVFKCDCDDPVAQRYATEIRDILATSPRYQEGSSHDVDGDGKPLKEWTISVVAASMPPKAAAISIAFTYGDILADQNVQVCGMNKVKECAEAAVSMLDAVVTKTRSQ